MTQKIYFNQSCKYPFDLDKVLYAAQDFRWCKWDDDWHSGVLNGNLIHIRQVDRRIWNTSPTQAPTWTKCCAPTSGWTTL